ncbi:winged helix-turn-helix transcriptional regulator [Metallosphaera tengchongensis]|uniref:Winged helix-turn-helix transcriptional regulator n=1 Tax=Metallosphaera tengchongensis TaxID=1532350 RepID=A0A6N0NWV7_9CREN|nr:winged helix-turn-helix domain-containing protein [Metallosphaera tengchongensis]QKQ99609.1 winged helix-turn-helix transcriptional regulator [Metallosphaera tengchongensis]
MENQRERKQVKKLFTVLFLSSRGGYTRLRLMSALMDSPMNANQLSNILSLDYKTVIHHLEVLMDNQIVVRDGDGYGALFRPSKFFLTHKDLFREVTSDVKFTKSMKKEP